MTVVCLTLCPGLLQAFTGPTVTEPSGTGYPHTSPCGFPTVNGDQPFSQGTLTTCHQYQISGCASGSGTGTLPPLTVYVASTIQGSGKTVNGTIVLHDGGGGTTFFNAGGINSQGVRSTYAQDYYNAGYNIVQLAWAEPWQVTSDDAATVNSYLKDACRPATLFQNIYNNLALPTGKPMCAQGHSGGAAAVGYAMAWYGAAYASTGYLGTVLLTSGPAYSDVQAGCQYDGTTTMHPAVTVCDQGKCVGGSSTPSFPACAQYPNNVSDCRGNTYPTGQGYGAAKSVSWETILDGNQYYQSENNCNNWRNNSQKVTTHLNATWAGMSVVQPLGSENSYIYPHTYVYGFLCHTDIDHPDPSTTTSNSSSAQGWDFLSGLTTSASQNNNGTPNIYRVDSCTGPEMIWGDNAIAEGTSPLQSGYIASEQAMESNCKNTH